MAVAGALLTFAACGVFPIDDDAGTMGAAPDGATEAPTAEIRVSDGSSVPGCLERPELLLTLGDRSGRVLQPDRGNASVMLPARSTSRDRHLRQLVQRPWRLDPANWMSYESGIGGVCTERSLRQRGVGGIGAGPDDDPKCDASDWSSVNPAHLNGPDVSGSECNTVDYSSLELDPTGSTIVGRTKLGRNKLRPRR